MNKYIRGCLFVVCLIVFIISALKIKDFYADYSKASSDYDEAEQAFSIPEKVPLPALEETTTEEEIIKEAQTYFQDCDYKALKNLNTEICGWIVIPSLDISYPILQHKDNSYYLTHLYNHEENHVGSIFMDYRVANDFTDFNTILYGHNMRDKSMFARLHDLRKKKAWKKNPYVFIYNNKGLHTYKIFAAYTGDPDGLAYKTGIRSDNSKQEVINYCLRHAYYNTKVVPTTADSILTLSTCSDREHKTRMIVQAMLIKD